MTQQTATLGPLQMRLASVEYRAFRAECPEPFLLLEDGTEVQVFHRGSERYLLVDHRRDSHGPARVEFWELESSPECRVSGLYAVVEALRP